MFPRSKIISVLDTIATYKSMGQVAVSSRLGDRRKGRTKGQSSIQHQKHLLILAWPFPPSIAGGVFRPLSIAKYGTSLGWKISVITRPMVGNPTDAGTYLLQSLPNEVQIWRVKETKPTPNHSWVPSVDGGFMNALNTFLLGKNTLNADPPDVILATGPPFQSFVAAHYLAKYFHSRLVLDYRDEWTECPFDFVKLGNVDRKWENICLNHADLVFFTTASQLSHHVKTFPVLDHHKCRVVSNGWEPDDFETPSSIYGDRKDANMRKFIISYIGTLSNHALPGKFLKPLEIILGRRKDLKNILELRFVGEANTIAKREVQAFQYQENVQMIHHVRKDIANAMMKQSNALLIFNNERLSRYIPGKLYDYLASETPILIFGSGGEISSLVTKLERGFIVEEDDIDTLEHTLDIMNSHDGNIKMNRDDKFNDWLSSHTRKKLAEKMLMEIENMK